MFWGLNQKVSFSHTTWLDRNICALEKMDQTPLRMNSKVSYSILKSSTQVCYKISEIWMNISNKKNIHTYQQRNKTNKTINQCPKAFQSKRGNPAPQKMGCLYAATLRWIRSSRSWQLLKLVQNSRRLGTSESSWVASTHFEKSDSSQNENLPQARGWKQKHYCELCCQHTMAYHPLVSLHCQFGFASTN